VEGSRNGRETRRNLARDRTAEGTSSLNLSEHCGSLRNSFEYRGEKTENAETCAHSEEMRQKERGPSQCEIFRFLRHEWFIPSSRIASRQYGITSKKRKLLACFPFLHAGSRIHWSWSQFWFLVFRSLNVYAKLEKGCSHQCGLQTCLLRESDHDIPSARSN